MPRSKRHRASERHPSPVPLQASFERRALVWSVPLTLAVLVIYFATAARDIVFGDSPELTTAALTLGVAHPPGYPLFTLAGWLFGQIPAGGPAFRVGLLSVTCHAATVALVYLMTYRFTRSISGALVAGATLAFAPLFWSWSLVPEVFPLNDLLSVALLFLVALWHEQPERRALLIAAGFVGGIGMTNQQTIALLAPAVLYIMLRRRDFLSRDLSLLPLSAIAFAIGLTPYLWLLLAAAREPAWSWGDLRGVGDLLGHMTRQSYGTTALVSEPTFAGGTPVTRMIALVAALDPVQGLLLLGGSIYAWRTLRWFCAFVLIAFIFSGPLFAVYANVNLDAQNGPLLLEVLQRFFLLPIAVIAPLAGFAVVWAQRVLRRRGLTPRAAVIAPAIFGISAALAFVPIEYGALDRSEDHIARAYAMDVLASVKPDGILLAGSDGVAFPILYMQAIEGTRPDVTAVFLPVLRETWYVRELRRAHPELALPLDHYGTRDAPFRAFLDANRSRPMALVGDFLDDSGKGAYYRYPRGITFEVRTVDQGATLEQLASDNEHLLATYHPTPFGEVTLPYRAWDRLTLTEYGLAYYRVGSEYEAAANNLKANAPEEARKGFDVARNWYQRALAVDPVLPEAMAGLARLPR